MSTHQDKSLETLKAELDRVRNALYLEVTPEIADDVFNRVIAAAQKYAEEREREVALKPFSQVQINGALPPDREYMRGYNRCLEDIAALKQPNEPGREG